MKKIFLCNLLLAIMLMACNSPNPTSTINPTSTTDPITTSNPTSTSTIDPNVSYRMEYGKNSQVIEMAEECSAILSDTGFFGRQKTSQNQVITESKDYSFIYDVFENKHVSSFPDSDMVNEALKYVFAAVELYTQFKPADDSPFGKVFYKEPTLELKDYGQEYAVYLHIEEFLSEEERLIYVRYEHYNSVLLHLDKDNKISIFNEVFEKRGTSINSETNEEKLNDEYNSFITIWADNVCTQANLKTTDYTGNINSIISELKEASSTTKGDYLIDKYFDIFKDDSGLYDMNPLTDINGAVDITKENYINFDELKNMGDDLYLNFDYLAEVFYIRNHINYVDPSRYSKTNTLIIEGTVLKEIRLDPVFLEVPSSITAIEDFVPTIFRELYGDYVGGIYIPSNVIEVNEKAFENTVNYTISSIFVDYTKEDCPFNAALENSTAKIYYLNEFVWLGNVCVPLEQHLVKGDIVLVPEEPSVEDPSTSEPTTSEDIPIIQPYYGPTIYFANTLSWSNLVFYYDEVDENGENLYQILTEEQMIGYQHDGTEVYEIVIPQQIQSFVISGYSMKNKPVEVIVNEIESEKLLSLGIDENEEITYFYEIFDRSYVIDEGYHKKYYSIYFSHVLENANFGEIKYFSIMYWTNWGCISDPYPGEIIKDIVEEDINGKFIYKIKIPSNVTKIQFFVHTSDGIVESPIVSRKSDIFDCAQYSLVWSSNTMELYYGNYVPNQSENVRENIQIYFENTVNWTDIKINYYVLGVLFEAHSNYLMSKTKNGVGKHNKSLYTAWFNDRIDQIQISGIPSGSTKREYSPLMDIVKNNVYYLNPNENGSYSYDIYEYDPDFNIDDETNNFTIYFEDRMNAEEVKISYLSVSLGDFYEIPVTEISKTSDEGYKIYAISIPATVYSMMFEVYSKDLFHNVSIWINEIKNNYTYYLLEELIDLSGNSFYTYGMYL